VVNVTAAAREAREKVWAVRRGDTFRAEAQRIVKKHASRKDGGAGRHFVDDREKRGTRNADTRQMKLDL
jgi:deoxyribodipyrimidine photo-lyase